MRRRDALAAVAGGLTAGCGYALVGKGITTDASVKRIGVPLFKDKTGKPGLDQRVTQAVMEELLKRGRFVVVRETTNVDAVVEGEILSYNAVPVNFGQLEGRSQTNRYAIALVASVVYRKTGVKEPIWSNDAFSQRDEYDVDANPASYFDRENLSIDRLAASFARGLVAAMLEAF